MTPHEECRERLGKCFNSLLAVDRERRQAIAPARVLLSADQEKAKAIQLLHLEAIATRQAMLAIMESLMVLLDEVCEIKQVDNGGSC